MTAELRRVKITEGHVVGLWEDGCAVFKGIPYAKPPVGALRFAPPEPPEPWVSERECFAYGPSPIPSRGSAEGQSEDCLTVNVWTPAESVDEQLPVMFWIYGGGFQNGTSADLELDGAALAKKGVVVVTFNYRLGALGFFAHPELLERSRYRTTCNYGILDELAALQWVQRNIAAFGGDPKRVTIFGQSAGGISCRILLASPEARGLFRRVIVESGGGLNEADPVRPMAELMDISESALRRLGWTPKDVLTREAREVNEKLAQAAKEVVEGFEVGVFQPCVDGLVVPKVPGVALAAGEYPADVNVICGTVCGDSWMFCRKVCAALGEDDATLRGFSYSPSQSWARNQARNGRQSIRAYYFERTQPPRQRHVSQDGVYRYGKSCPHSSEIAYVFGTLPCRYPTVDDRDLRLSELLMAYWSNFAKTGDPNGIGLPQWPEYSVEQPVTLHISDGGVEAENIVDSTEGAHVVEYTIAHPGMLETLTDF